MKALRPWRRREYSTTRRDWLRDGMVHVAPSDKLPQSSGRLPPFGIEFRDPCRYIALAKSAWRKVPAGNRDQDRWARAVHEHAHIRNALVRREGLSCESFCARTTFLSGKRRAAPSRWTPSPTRCEPSGSYPLGVVSADSEIRQRPACLPSARGCALSDRRAP